MSTAKRLVEMELDRHLNEQKGPLVRKADV
jgi:hypothetical protein